MSSLLAFPALAQTTIYVNAQASGAADGTTPSSAYKTIVEAVKQANATSGTGRINIKIAAGTYYPLYNLTAFGSHDSAICVGRSNLFIEGGYAANFLGTPDTTANPVILTGNRGSGLNNFHLMVIHQQGDDSISVSNITFRNATGSNGTSVYPQISVPAFGRSVGGVYVLTTGSNRVVTFTNCTFHSSVNVSGGGIYNEGAILSVKGSRFFGNLPGTLSGAAIVVNKGRLIAENSTFSGNRAEAVVITGTADSSQFKTCTFTSNTAGTLGGAINSARPLKAENCVFTQNASTQGGAVYVTEHAEFTGCSFNGNTASSQGGAIKMLLSAKISQCSFSGNTATSSHGGAVHAAGKMEVDNSSFTTNTSIQGGGIYISTGDILTATSCTFNGNRAVGGSSSADGGAIRSGGAVRLYSSRFTNNTGAGGAALLVAGGALENCTFVGNNYAGVSGKIVTMFGNSVLKSCNFKGNWCNTTNSIGDLLYFANGTSELYNCELSGNKISTAITLSQSDPSHLLKLYNCAIIGNDGRAISSAAYTNTITVNNSIIWGNTTKTLNAGLLARNSYLEQTGNTTYPAVSPYYNYNEVPLISPAIPASGSLDSTRHYLPVPCSGLTDNGIGALYPNAVAGNTDLSGNNRIVRRLDIGPYEYQYVSDELALGALPDTVVLGVPKGYGDSLIDPLLTLTVAGGSGNFQYEWERTTGLNSKFAVYVNTASPSLPPLPVSETAQFYRLKVTDGVCVKTSGATRVSFARCPEVTAQPVSRSAPAGNSATLSVTATGAATLLYNWQSFNEAGQVWQSTGNTASSLSVTSPSPGQIKYRCIVSSSALACMDTSSEATVTFYACSTPVISYLSADTTIEKGSTLNLAVSGAGPDLEYQWQKNQVNIASATSASLAITNYADALSVFRVLVKQGTCTTTSADITVKTVCPSALIQIQPLNRVVNENTSTAISCAANASMNPGYQWQNLAGSSWVDMVTTANYSLGVVTTGQGTRYYRCVVSGYGICRDTSRVVLVKVGTPCTDPDISAHPQVSTDVAPGATVTLTGSATSNPNGRTLSYSWVEGRADNPEWVFAAAANNASYSPSTSTPGSRYYRLLAKDGECYRMSNYAVVNVCTPPQLITDLPAEAEVGETEATQLSVQVTGTGLAYRWLISNSGGGWDLIANTDGFSGAATTILTIPANPALIGKKIKCEVVFGQCVTTSSQTSLIEPRKVAVKAVLTACPEKASGVEIQLELSGNFGSSPVFNVYKGDTLLGSSQLYNNVSGRYHLTLQDALAVGAHKIKVVDTTTNTGSPDFDFQLTPYAVPGIQLNGQAVAIGGNFATCPGSTIQVNLSVNADSYFGSNAYPGATYQINSSDTVTAAPLNIFTFNSTGCISATPYKVFLTFKDSLAPAVWLSTPANAVIPVGDTSVQYDLTTIIDSISDNCSSSGMLTKTWFTGAGVVVNAPSAYPLITGNNAFLLKVEDAAGNVVQRSVTIKTVSTPKFALSSPARSTNGIGGTTVDITVTGTGSSLLREYSAISGTIDFGGFAKQASMSLLVDGTAFTSSFNNGVLSYSATGVKAEENAALFAITIIPAIAKSDTDEVYTPAITANWLTTDGFTALITSALGKTTLEGLAVVSGELKTPENQPFNGHTQITCSGCVNSSGISNSVTLTDGNTYKFRAVPGESIAIVVKDLSGTSPDYITTGHVMANRQFVLGTSQLSPETQPAADVDNSGRVNTLDVLHQREVLVGTRTKFKNIFDDASSYNYLVNGGRVTGFVTEKKTHSFDVVVYKIGEVNLKSGGVDEFILRKMKVYMPEITCKKSELIRVPVIASSVKDIAGYQFSVEWEPSSFEFRNITPGKHSLFPGKTKISQGILQASYLEESAKNMSVAAGDTLFWMEFAVLPGATYSNRIAVNSVATAARAYDEKTRAMELVCPDAVVYVSDAASISESNERYKVFAAVPNPFTDHTSVSFELTNDQQLTFTVYSTLGTMVSESGFYTAGLHTWRLSSTDELAVGMYYITIRGEGIDETLKVIKE
ncbi:MAG: right-handed parallel beta-helix repeat-containing protein [Bacteroidota bacterium]